MCVSHQCWIIWVECLLLFINKHESLWSTPSRFPLPFLAPAHNPQISRPSWPFLSCPVTRRTSLPPHPTTVPIRTSWFISFRLYSWAGRHSFLSANSIQKYNLEHLKDKQFFSFNSIDILDCARVVEDSNLPPKSAAILKPHLTWRRLLLHADI